MTPTLRKEDAFMPVHLLPASLQARARKNPILFTGTLNLLEQMVKLKTMDPPRGAEMENTFYEYFRLFFEQLERLPKGYVRGLSTMRAMDDIMSTAERALPENKTISCKKGCNHCCHMRVSVPDSEAEVLASHIKRLGLRLDRALVESQQDLKTDAHQKLSWERRKCPLLTEDGSCSIHQWRPTACRKYAVVSPPEMCNPRTHKNAWIVSDMRAEALSAAILALEHTEERVDKNLPSQLLRRFPESSNVWR